MRSLRASLGLLALFPLLPIPAPAASPASPAPTATSSPARPRVLFIGNSFLFGSGSPVRGYRAHTVNDLNQAGLGGVPALFQAFAEQAGLAYDVSLETASGMGLDFHLREKADLIGRPWDLVILQSHSLLDRERPGDPTLLLNSARGIAALLERHHPGVDLRLIATWARADQVYPTQGAWHGKGLAAMTRDLRQAYDRAAATSPRFTRVLPVGEAWLRAMEAGIADPNPYDGIAAGQLSLWTHDHYHASTAGYYLQALVIFGDVTGLDPTSLGPDEQCAFDLGLSKSQATSLQKVARDELAAASPPAALHSFTTRARPRGPVR
ncbi:MAG: PEP-CTERM sorting domain-containing protein [Opitutaceae bacterium]